MDIVTFDAFEKKIKLDMKKIIIEKSKTLLLVAQEILNTLRETVEAVTDELQKSVIDSLQDIKPISNQNILPNKSSNRGRHEKFVPLKNEVDETKRISTYECLECGNIYQNPRSLRKHEKRIHLEIKNLECPKCDYATDERCRLDTHIESRHPDHVVGYSCSICEYSVHRKINLKRHYLDVHDIKDCRSIKKIKTDRAKRLENDVPVMVTVNDSLWTENEANPLFLSEFTSSHVIE